ncbi:MerR family transcriptional regulator [Actinomadura viridis]|uniref:MerR family transcriptional regulator n=1 Tax=Actinomadura viridis TaxID=58110 RepID=UPI00367D3521
MESTWTIAELAERAAAALASGESVQVNGRVRDLPNERLIRWYGTIGLVDPPLGRRGRTALYGTRHLLQIVAVKRRQAEGRSIAQIQVELAGATDGTLREIARMPEHEPGGHPEPASPPASAPEAQAEPRRDRFWTARPSAGSREDGHRPASPAPASPAPAPALAQDVLDVQDMQDVQEAQGVQAVRVQGVRLAPGLTLLLDVPAGVSALDDDDLAALGTAARPLLEELRRRGLLDPPGPLPDIRPADPSGRSQ